jgi:hypothetical protein
MGIKVIEDRWRPTCPETEYHRHNMDELYTYRKDTREEAGKVLDRADSFLNRGSISKSQMAKRIWPAGPR